MEKKIVKTITLEEDVINYIQSIYEDYRAKQDLITMIFELHKNDEDDSIIKSKPFISYEKKFMKVKIAYDTCMKEIQKKYIPDEYKNDNYRFEINFENRKLEIY